MNADKQIKNEKLTAYALGELDFEQVQEVEAYLEKNPEHLPYIAEMKAMAAALETELKAEPMPTPKDRYREVTLAPVSNFAKWKKALTWGFVPTALASGALAFFVFRQVPELAQKTSANIAVESLPVGKPDDNAADKSIVTAQTEKGAPTESDAMMAESEISAAPSASAPMSSGEMSSGKNISAGIGSGASFAKKRGDGAMGYAGPMGLAPLMPEESGNTESYSLINDNEFKNVKDEALSTFSIDVDTASYSNLRRYITQMNSLPPKDAIRIEEMINYFPYDYAGPKNGDPFAVHVEQAKAPWNSEHKLVRVGIKGKDIDWGKRESANLVFLLDVSGSMDEPNKLPLLKESFRLLVNQMRGDDRIAIVVYAGASGLVLPSTTGKNKDKILSSLERLQAGGSTNGASGIELAYKTVRENFIKGGINRVILATDGDFNVGPSSQGELVRIIEQNAKSGAFLTVLGFGSGNYKDSTLEMLADKGNGNYGYIDELREAKKLMVDQIGGTMVTIAKDVKIQVEFNPNEVAAYRLIGYENRMLNKEDFNDDKKDAGEIGAGHTVTALYELIPAGQAVPGPSVDKLRYQPTSKPEEKTPPEPTKAKAGSDELLTVKIRFKKPDGDVSTKIEVPLKNETKSFEQASPDFKFASSVAGFGMILRNSKFKGSINHDWVIETAEKNLKFKGQVDEYRSEFLQLVRKAKGMNR